MAFLALSGTRDKTMQAQIEKLQERNRAIGQVLLEARSRKHIPVTKCAELLGTSRRRYTEMERGRATIGVAELEVLMDFLEVPSNKVWGKASSATGLHQVVLQALPGETVQIVVAIQKEQ